MSITEKPETWNTQTPDFPIPDLIGLGETIILYINLPHFSSWINTIVVSIPLFTTSIVHVILSLFDDKIN